MNQININNLTKEDIKELETMEKVLLGAMEKEKLVDTHFDVIIVDNEYIHKLNKEYRGIDRPTDVISFALEDSEDIKYEDFRLLGDIYIAIDVAYDQATQYNHSKERTRRGPGGDRKAPGLQTNYNPSLIW